MTWCSSPCRTATPRHWPAQLPESVTVIDCGADFRLRDEQAWTTFYDTPYAGSWAYGLPELPVGGGGRQREALVGTSHIAVPGCYPTAVSLALAPGFAAGLLSGEDVVVVAASGTSGAGKSLKPHLLGAEVMGAMSPYGVGGVHRHTPEIEQNLTAASGPTGPMSASPSRRRWRRCRGGSSRPAPPASSTPRAARTQPAYGRPGRRPTPTSRSSTCCPKGSGPPPRASSGATASTSRSLSTSGSGASSPSRPSTTSPRERRVPLCSA